MVVAVSIATVPVLYQSVREHRLLHPEANHQPQAGSQSEYYTRRHVRTRDDHKVGV